MKTRSFIKKRGLLGVGLALMVAGLVLLALGLYSLLGRSGSSGGSQLILDRAPPIVDYSIAVDINAGPVNNSPPVRMVIESIGLDAQVMTLGMDADRVPLVPDDTNSPDAGHIVVWYDFSAKPGQTSNAVFAGHVSWHQAPAVFWALKDIKVGDTIRVFTAEGKELVYQVAANFAVDPSDPNSIKVMDPTRQDIVTLITCGGSWLPNPSEPLGGNYSNRIIVQAKLLTANVAVPAQ